MKISEKIAEALAATYEIIEALPDDPDNANDAWELFKVFQVRDSLKAVYQYEKDKERMS